MLRILLIEKISRVLRLIRWYRLLISGYRNIHKRVVIEGGVRLDKLNKKGIFIREGVLIARGAVILSHSHVIRDPDNSRIPKFYDTYIGMNSFIGINAIILPGVRIGNQCIIGDGAVVTKNVPNRTMVAGNPARIVKENLFLCREGIYEEQ